MANHYSLFQLRDRARQLSTAKIYNGPITALSLPGFLTELGQMRTAIDNITLGIIAQESWVGDLTVISAALPTDENARRERKWLGRYHDTVTSQKYTFEIPTADLTVGMIPESDYGDITQGALLAFKTRFDSFARSPDSDANAVVLDSMQHVGRNL